MILFWSYSTIYFLSKNISMKTKRRDFSWKKDGVFFGLENMFFFQPKSLLILLFLNISGGKTYEIVWCFHMEGRGCLDSWCSLAGTVKWTVKWARPEPQPGIWIPYMNNIENIYTYMNSLYPYSWNIYEFPIFIIWMNMNQFPLHTEKSFRNFNKSNLNQIVFTIFLDWFGTENRQCPFAVPYQSVHRKYNMISV